MNVHFTSRNTPWCERYVMNDDFVVINQLLSKDFDQQNCSDGSQH